MTPQERNLAQVDDDLDRALEEEIADFEDSLSPAEQDEIEAEEKAEERRKIDEHMQKALDERSKEGFFDTPGAIKALGGFAKGSVKFTEDILNTGVEVVNELGDQDFTKFDYAPEPGDSLADQIGFGVGRYLAPFGLAYGGLARLGLRGAALGVSAVGAGAITSAVSVDPDDKNLSQLMNDVPWLEGIVPDYLATDPDDTQAERRLKIGLESALVDITTLGTVKAGRGLFKALKNTKARRNAQKAAKLEDEVIKQKPKEGVEGAAEAAPAKDIEVIDINKQLKEKQAARLRDSFKKFTDEEIDIVSLSADPKQLIESFELIQDASFKQAFENMKRGKIPMDSIKLKAQELFKDPKKLNALMSRKPGQPLAAEEIAALSMAMDAQYKLIQKVRKSTFKNGTFANEADRALFNSMISKFRRIAASVKGGVSESARGMRTWQETFESTKDAAKQVGLMEEYNKLFPEGEAVAGMFEALEKQGVSSIQIGSKLASRMNEKAEKVLYELWYNSVLSGPLTHMKNMVGNSYMMVSSDMRKFMAAGLQRGDAIAMGRAKAHFGAKWSSMKEIWQFHKELIANKQIPKEFTEKFRDKFPDFGGESVFSSDADNALGATARTIGKAVNLPRTALQYEDMLFKIANYRARANELAYVRASELFPAASGKELKEKSAQILGNLPSDIEKEAIRYANEQTFTLPVSQLSFGKQMDSVQKFIETVPYARVMVPFTGVVSNLANDALEYIPLINKVPGTTVQQKMMGSAQDRAEAVSKMIMGGSAITVGAGLASAGFLIGSGSRNYRAKQALRESAPGYKENSLVVGDELSKFYIPVDDSIPIVSVMLMGADMAQLRNYLDADSEHIAEDLMAGGMAIVADRLTPEYLTDSMPELLGAFDKAQDARISTKNFGKVAGDFSSSLVPYKTFANQVVRPFTADEIKDLRPDPNQSQIKQMWEAFTNRVLDSVGMAGELPPIKNMFGDQISPPPGMLSNTWSAMFHNKEADPLIDELRKLGMEAPLGNVETGNDQDLLKFQMPSRVLHKMVLGKSVPVKLTPKEYAELIDYTSGKDRKVSLRDAMGDIVFGERGEKWTDERKRVELLKVKTKFYREGTKRFLQKSQRARDIFDGAAGIRNPLMRGIE